MFDLLGKNQKNVDKAIHRIILYPLDSAIDFVITIHCIVIYLTSKRCRQRYALDKFSIQGIPQLVFLLLIRWVVIYPMDSGI